MEDFILSVLPKVRQAVKLSEKEISLKNIAVEEERSALIPNEGYELKITESGITARASGGAGFFYARQTLEALKETGTVKEALITDYPEYPYRGYMLDTARHFFSVETVKKQIDVISRLKMNVFHWHLTDDQGWRFYSDKYPLLTKSGEFYTKEEMLEVVSYAAERFVTVIPEIDMPGHMTAAISAYPELSCDGKKIEISNHYGIHQNVLCAGKEKVYDFCRDILDEVCEVFPSEMVHLGGDEALRLKWLDCPDCRAAIEREGLKDEDELQAYFMSRLTAYLAEKGRTVANWNDGMRGANSDASIIIHYWQEGQQNAEALIAELDKGRKCIMSPFFSYYLDYPYIMTPLRKTFAREIPSGNGTGSVLGVECPLWTEYVKTPARLEFMSYPRTAAVAETGWSAAGGDYADFKRRLRAYRFLFDKSGVKCAKLLIAEGKPFVAGAAVLVWFGISALIRSAGSLKLVSLNKKKLRAKYGK